QTTWPRSQGKAPPRWRRARCERYFFSNRLLGYRRIQCAVTATCLGAARIVPNIGVVARCTRIAVKSGHGTLDVSRTGTNPWRLPRNDRYRLERAYTGLRPEKVITA